MEGRLFADLVGSRGDGGARFRAAGLPFSFVVHAAGMAGLLALSMAVPGELPPPQGLAIPDVMLATGPRPPARPGPRPPVSRTPRAAPRGLAAVLETAETPEITPEPFAPDGDESETACIGCALSDEDTGGGGGDGPGFGDHAGDPGATGPATAPVRVGGHIRAPLKIRHVDPAYPDLARRAGVTGIVVLECMIDRDGRVQTVRVASGHPLLNEAALGAVRQWAYQPTLLNGVPVAVVMTVTVRFVMGTR